MIQAIIDINPDADGVRCGECVGPLYVKECDCCKPRTVCHGRMLDGKTREFVRGPECLAAERRHQRMVDALRSLVSWAKHGEVLSGSQLDEICALLAEGAKS